LAKVSNLRCEKFSSALQENVGWLQVAMNQRLHRIRVNVAQRFNELIYPKLLLFEFGLSED
jgi:hypothetical protein